MEPTIELVDEPGPEIRAAIGQPLKRLNEERAGEAGATKLLAVTLKASGSDDVVGSLWGWTSRGYLYVDLLFVPDAMRERGIGRSLMRHAEQEAVDRGCHSAYLSTYSFQAPGFYRELGYRVFGELPDYPPGHSSIFLTKRLVPIMGTSP